MSSHRSVFGLGQCSLDIIGRIDAYPPPDVKCEFHDMVIQGGGPAATALVALSRWGLSCYFSGVRGDDLFGEMIETALREEGVETRGMIVRRGSSSQTAFIAAESGVGSRTIFWQRPTGDPPRPDELDLNRIRHARLFHTDGLMMEASLFGARVAREANVIVSVDAGTLREGMLDLARLADIFVVSEIFSRQLVGGDEPEEACRRLAGRGPRLVGVTLGARGYVAVSEGKLTRKPAYRVPAIDTTGCGDVFHAGVAYGFVQGWRAEKSLDFAAWAAAQVSTKMGGRSGIPRVEDYQERIGD